MMLAYLGPHVHETIIEPSRAVKEEGFLAVLTILGLASH